MHVYELDGIEYPSVTTIIKLISTNEELLKWANVMGFKHKDIAAIKEESAIFGTGTHAHIRNVVDINSPVAEPFKDPRHEYAWSITKRNFLNYFKDINYKTIDTEITLISKKYGYGGTLDWLTNLEYNGHNIIFLGDFKTSKAPHQSMFLQLGGYYNLLLEIGIDPDMAGIITLNEKSCLLHPITKDKLIDYAKSFLRLVAFYQEWNVINNYKPDYDIIHLFKKQPVNIT